MNSRTAPANDRDQEIEANVRWLRTETLGTLLIAVAALLWMGIIPYLLQPETFWRGWGLLAIALLVTGGCYALRERSYRLASGLFIVMLVLVVSVRLLATPGGEAAYLYAPVVLIVGALTRLRVAVLIALFATILVVADTFLSTPTATPVGNVQIVLAIWLALLIAWLTRRNLSMTLHWYRYSQQEATKNLEETQRHRGELAAALKQLTDASYRLERLNYALNWARMDAEQARRAKAQFAAHVSHELRTPINLVVGFSDMMLNVPQAYGGAQLPLAFQTDLETLHRSAKHLQGLIDDILDLSQLDAREMPLLRESVAVETVIGEAVAAIRQLLQRKNLSIAVDIDPAVTVAYLDPLRIRQVLLNLLSNASRHTVQGGISIRAWREGDDVLIAVADTGQGIDPREIPYLFEAFHRLPQLQTAIHEGWGLGLAICKQFIELHGGTIGAASEGIPGRGTTFTMRVPTYAAVTEPPSGTTTLGRPFDNLAASVPAPTVVVIGADARAVSLYRRHLSGYHVIGAPTEAEALGLARSVTPHAVLVNLPSVTMQANLPESLSALVDQEGVRVLGCSIPSGQQLARLIGLRDFLIKPVAREALVAAVQRANPTVQTIAVIDDDPHMARMLSRMLRSAGQPWHIVRAHGTEEGLALIRRARPEVVLLDLLMPGSGGLAIVEAVRSEPALSGIAMIAVSAQDIEEVVPACSSRLLTLATNRAMTASQMLREIRALLDVLPPAETERLEPAPVPPRGLAGSVASG